MTRTTRLLAAFAAVTAAVAVTAVAGLSSSPALAATANPLPADAAAKGYIGLCNEDGQNVTGGSIKTKPFIWNAVASVPPPAGYQGKGQTAVLGIVQPRPGTGVLDWNGTPLTSPSYYKHKSAPTVQATYADRSLQSVIAQFPPEVDGLYVLRMYFGRLNYGNYNATYPTTTIQVTGTSWRVVKGGTVDCHRATAVSNEQLTGVAGKTQTTPRKPSPAQRTVDTAQARSISVSAGSVRSAAPGGGGSSNAVPGGRTSINASPAADSSQSSSQSSVVWVLVGIVALLVVALGAALRRRRSTSSGS